MLPPRSLSRALKPLCYRDIELIAAVRPAELDEVPVLLRAARDAGLRCGLWPMLADADGRWPSRANVVAFGDFAARVLDAAPADAPPSLLAVDLEPPFGLLARWFSRTPETTAVAATSTCPEVDWGVCVQRFDAIVRDARARGVAVLAAAVPMAALDPRHEAGGAWQRWMGTPVDAVDWDHITAMLYTSIFEGWSRGVLRREDARALLFDGCVRVGERWGARAGVSLGAVSTGALGDEPIYRSPSELADDVALCTSAGITELSLFDYAGALARGSVDAWLDAFTAPPIPVARPSPSRRVRALLSAARLAGHAPF